MDRFVCIHGHFYQPPRENPWLEAVELQDSAYPYHDWNERVTAECYAPNAAARILDQEGRIVRIVNNYSRMSFNFGPTLLHWMRSAMPETHEAIVEADRLSRDRFSGHGSALSQVYNHMILPLANRRDKETQIIWGLRDFAYRFGRPAEGIWLSETAVDLETLDILSAHGVRFTILAPRQAHRVRRKGTRNWKDVSGGRIDPSVPYVQILPSGRSIAIFFYDGPISQAVAFEGLLRDGEHFAQRIVSGFSDSREGPQLVHLATDGESYGHHHPHGEMALAYALDHLETHGMARLTNYGEFLEMNPPQANVEIWPDSSWSCVHGIERWRADCGCNSGDHPEWRQAWRAPLRESLDWLRDRLMPAFEKAAGTLFADPWVARNAYVDVVLDRSPESISRFLSEHSAESLREENTVRALQLMELARHAMLMYTSCGWFFDELSGIETVQVIQYAGRAVQLARQCLGLDVEEEFLQRLEKAPSNVPEHRNGRMIYEKWVRSTQVDLYSAGAHYAVSSFFEDYGPHERVYGFEVERGEHRAMQSGVSRLLVGTIRVTSVVTRETDLLSYGFLHMADHNLTGGVRSYRGPEEFVELMDEVSGAFAAAELAEVIRVLDRHFGELTYSLRSLFRDEQRKAISRILESSLADTASVYAGVYERFVPLMRFLRGLGYPNPEAFRAAASVVLHARLREALDKEEVDQERTQALLQEAVSAGITLDEAGLSFRLRRRLDRRLRDLKSAPDDLALLGATEADARLTVRFPFTIELWAAESTCYELLVEHLGKHRALAEAGDRAAALWVEQFLSLATILHIRAD